MGNFIFIYFKTPIQYCSAIPNGENQVKFLLENGADPFIKDKTGRDSLDIAKLFEREETIKILEREIYLKLRLYEKGKPSIDLHFHFK